MSELVRETQSKLEYLGMDAMSRRLEELATSPEGLGLSPLALLEELVDAQYGLASTQLYERLSGKSGIPQGNYEMDRLRSDGKRMYPEEHMARLRTFEFMEPRTCHNIAVFGKSYAGKTYFLRAIGLEACRRGKSVIYVDFAMLVSDLKDRKASGLRSFKRRLNLYARKDLLIIDDFLISPISEEEAALLVQVVNLREDCRKPIMVATQYDPSVWTSRMGSSSGYAVGDSIRRKLVLNAYNIVLSVCE